ARIADDIPDAELFGDDSGEALIVGWGGTFGALRAATKHLRARGMKVSHMHIEHLFPLPKNVGPALKRFDVVVCAELNMGQLKRLLRDQFLVDVQGLNKAQGQPFKVSEIVERMARGMAKHKAEEASR
ncbi:MAG: 2-oxoglutarate ferredoxin oxidoreductase subunit alpha, partial [Proteobacteria bacterium]